MGFHSNIFSTHENQCGSCARSEVSDRRLSCYCTKYGRTYPLDSSKCSSYVKDRSRNYDFWKKIYTYYILTAIFDILDMCKGNVIFQEVRTLIDLVREDETTVKEALGYEEFGPELADKLRMDPDRENISNFLFDNYIVKIYCLIKLNNTDDAIRLYEEMVRYLFVRYRNIDNYAELNDSDVKTKIK